MKIEKRYIDGTYHGLNPDWDSGDSAWKARKVLDMMQENDIRPSTICEIGCGAGGVMREMSQTLKETKFVGYDVAPALVDIWKQYTLHDDGRVTYRLGSVADERQFFDLLLMIDVFEHVRDPFTFLESVVDRANYFIFHIPLDLSAVNVFREAPLMKVRNKVGHLHFYTRNIALETLTDSGYRIIEACYTGAATEAPSRKLMSKIYGLLRALTRKIFGNRAVLLLGGETLIVLAKKNTGDE